MGDAFMRVYNANVTALTAKIQQQKMNKIDPARLRNDASCKGLITMVSERTSLSSPSGRRKSNCNEDRLL